MRLGAISSWLQYFEQHRLPWEWRSFLDDFQRHWPTDEDYTYVDFVREGVRGNGTARSGNPPWRRLTEVRAGAAKSVFHFDAQGSVAKSTHSGLPWLRYLHRYAAGRVHFWPFDGWQVPPGSSVVAEVYPSLWSNSFPRRGRNPDQARRLLGPRHGFRTRWKILAQRPKDEQDEYRRELIEDAALVVARNSVEFARTA